MALRRTHSAGYLANWLGRLLIRTISPKLELDDLSVGHLPIFFALTEHKALSQKQLALLAEVEQPTMAATLARMERDGLIVRTPDPADGRSAIVALTPLARKKLAAVEAAVDSTNADALRLLSATERKQWFALTRKMIEALGGRF